MLSVGKDGRKIGLLLFSNHAVTTNRFLFLVSLPFFQACQTRFPFILFTSFFYMNSWKLESLFIFEFSFLVLLYFIPPLFTILQCSSGNAWLKRNCKSLFVNYFLEQFFVLLDKNKICLTIKNHVLFSFVTNKRAWYFWNNLFIFFSGLFKEIFSENKLFWLFLLNFFLRIF